MNILKKRLMGEIQMLLLGASISQLKELKVFIENYIE